MITLDGTIAVRNEGDLRDRDSRERIVVNGKRASVIFPGEGEFAIFLRTDDKGNIYEMTSQGFVLTYTPEGEVKVGFKARKDALEIFVKDTGIGLTKKDKKEIFGRFIRGDRILQVHPNGTGLGLYIVDQVAKSMNGKAKADSPGVNKGSIFSIILPYAN